MDEIKSNVAKNIAMYRKQLNLTQLQLAERLNYSDKAVSKWERGEAVPDIYIMHELATMFNITVDELIGSDMTASPKHEQGKQPFKLNKTIITLLSAGLVWLIATIIFAALGWANVEGPTWLVFIYAIPVTAIVTIVFNVLWGKRIFTTILVSVLIWTIALAVMLTLPKTNAWLIFIVGIPLQILTVLWFFLKKKSK